MDSSHRVGAAVGIYGRGLKVGVGAGVWEGFGGESVGWACGRGLEVGTGVGMGEGIERRDSAGLEVGVQEGAGTGRVGEGAGQRRGGALYRGVHTPQGHALWGTATRSKFPPSRSAKPA